MFLKERLNPKKPVTQGIIDHTAQHDLPDDSTIIALLAPQHISPSLNHYDVQSCHYPGNGHHQLKPSQ